VKIELVESALGGLEVRVNGRTRGALFRSRRAWHAETPNGRTVYREGRDAWPDRDAALNALLGRS
jgi:hypothetical protein